jgi:hypothetical protein
MQLNTPATAPAHLPEAVSGSLTKDWLTRLMNVPPTTSLAALPLLPLQIDSNHPLFNTPSADAQGLLLLLPLAGQGVASQSQLP